MFGCRLYRYIRAKYNYFYPFKDACPYLYSVHRRSFIQINIKAKMILIRVTYKLLLVII